MLIKRLLILSMLLLATDAMAAGKKAVDFRLNNLDGKTVSLKALRGKVAVITFSYTYCTVRCPIITGRLVSLDAHMGAPADVVYLHVSVDPGMDTPQRRLEYFGLYGIDTEKDKRWMFVSGQREELKRVWNYYGVEVERVEEARLPEGYYMQYTPKLVIVGKDGIVRDETVFLFMEDEMASKILELARG